MEIMGLIERSNALFEILEYTAIYEDSDEIVSLKISINNLLSAIDSDCCDFFKTLLLSSPVLFDFGFNSSLDEVGARLRSRFERRDNYEDAKKWYKFVRNSLVHTNRYTFNNFLTAIYRIEYDEGAEIYFELDRSKVYRWEEFKQNEYFVLNEMANIGDDGYSTYEVDLNVRLRVNYHQFQVFVVDILGQMINDLESEVDSILAGEINKWNYYYTRYRQVVEDVYYDKQINIKSLRKLSKALRKVTMFDVEEAYVLCEFLVYIRDLDVELTREMLDDIIQITTFDKYAQLDKRQLIIGEISGIKTYERKYINYDLVAWVINEIYPLTTSIDQKLEILEHTNYLIMYVQKYLTLEGVVQ